jgi:hypothetical protein
VDRVTTFDEFLEDDELQKKIDAMYQV